MIDLRCGDAVRLLEEDPSLLQVDAVVADPPYGMAWRTDSTRFSGGKHGVARYRGMGRADWGAVAGDERPFDPEPWLGFKRVILWGSNHFGARLPVGTTLVWIKRADHLLGSWLSDAEIGWMKGGHGVYCHREQFPPPCRIREARGSAGRGRAAHPNQKPVGLYLWCFRKLKLQPGMTVLDPYMGSGSCGVAALEFGLHYIGIEIRPDLVEVARRRLAAARSATPLLA